MNKKTLGLILLVIGIGTILFAKTHPFTYQPNRLPIVKEVDQETEDIVMYCGLGVLVIGGIISAIEFTKKKTT